MDRLRPERLGLVMVAGLMLLTTAKFGIAQLSPPKADGRATADFIDRVTDWRIDDVVYVDNHAVWSLRFYLDAQVHEAWLRRVRIEPAYQAVPTLPQLLSLGDQTARRVYMVNPASTHDFELAMRDAGLCAQRLGHDPVSVAYRGVPAGSRSCRIIAATARGAHVHD
jgi:hypothetical protein